MTIISAFAVHTTQKGMILSYFNVLPKHVLSLLAFSIRFSFVIIVLFFFVLSVRNIHSYDFAVTRTTQIVYRSKPENYANSELCVVLSPTTKKNEKTAECEFHAFYPLSCVSVAVQIGNLLYTCDLTTTPNIMTVPYNSLLLCYYSLFILRFTQTHKQKAHLFRHFALSAHVIFGTDDSNT